MNDARLFDILLFDKLPFSLKIWSPVKVFRSLIRFLVGKKVFMTEFWAIIFDFLCLSFNLEIQFLKIYQNRHYFQSFLPLKFQTLNFVPIRVQTNRFSFIFFVPSSLIRYLHSVYRIRETSHYSIRSGIRWNSNSPWKSN